MGKKAAITGTLLSHSCSGEWIELNPAGNSGKWCKTHAWKLSQTRGKGAGAFIPPYLSVVGQRLPPEDSAFMYTDKLSSGGPRIALQQRCRCWPWKVGLD